MKDQKLADISKELIQAGQNLMYLNRKRLECIHRFCGCQNIVEWIRNTTKGMPSALCWSIFHCMLL